MARQKGSKQWTSNEIRLACRAYVNATNTHKGTDQKIDDFIEQIVQNMQNLSPSSFPAGTHHHRGATCFTYIRDHVFKDVQKFNRSLLLVDNAELSGVTDDEKINISVAHFQIGRPVMAAPYKYKSYNPHSWKYYAGWLEIKQLPKFSLNDKNETRLAMATNAVNESDVDGTPLVSGKKCNSIVTVTADGTSMSHCSRRSGLGRDATKAILTADVEFEKEQKEEAKKRKEWDGAFTVKIDAMVHAANSRVKQNEKAIQILSLEKYVKIMGGLMDEAEKQRCFKKLRLLTCPPSPSPLTTDDSTDQSIIEQPPTVFPTKESVREILFGKHVLAANSFDSSDDDCAEILAVEIEVLKRTAPSKNSVTNAETPINKKLQFSVEKEKQIDCGVTNLLVAANNGGGDTPTTAINQNNVVDLDKKQAAVIDNNQVQTWAGIAPEESSSDDYTNGCSEDDDVSRGRMLELDVYWDMDSNIEKQVMVVMSLRDGHTKDVDKADIVIDVQIRMKYEFEDDSIYKAIQGLEIDERIMATGPHTFQIMNESDDSNTDD
jgi:hypothetical protein